MIKRVASAEFKIKARVHLRWFLGIALRIPKAHDFREKKNIFLKLTSIPKTIRNHLKVIPQ